MRLSQSFSFWESNCEIRGFVEPLVRRLKAADFSPKKPQELKAQACPKTVCAAHSQLVLGKPYYL
jgi:hypothetical protein